MEKGYKYSIYKNDSEYVPSAWDFVYIDAIKANIVDPAVYDNWNKIKGCKKGLIHYVGLTSDATVSENGTKMHELIGNLGVGNFNDGVPLLIDIYDKTAGATFQIHQIREYVEYLNQRIKMIKKPILKIHAGTWDSWYENSYSEWKRLNDLVDPLILGWTANKPPAILEGSLIKWFEYGEFNATTIPAEKWGGLIAYDSTGMWEKSPQPPVVPPVIIPEPEDPPENGGEEVEDPVDVVDVNFEQYDSWNVDLVEEKEYEFLFFKFKSKGTIKGTVSANKKETED